MARGRPRKQTVDYFPHYTGASDGKTLFILQNRFGNDGYAFWFRLLEILGSSEGHYFDYRKAPEWQFLLAKTGISDDNKATEILKALADLDAIDVGLYEQKIIWSQNFVDNLADLYKRRAIEVPRKPVIPANNKSISVDRKCLYCGKDITEMRADAKYCSEECRLKAFRETHNDDNRFIASSRDAIVSTNNNQINVNNNVISTSNNHQSKVKESKVNNSRGGMGGTNSKDLYKILEGTKGFPVYSQENVWKLEDVVSDYPEVKYLLEFKKFREYWNTRKLKRPWLALRNWLGRAKEGNGKVRNTRDLPEKYTDSPDYPD